MDAKTKLLEILSGHVGKDHRISREYLHDTLTVCGYAMSDRRMREAIEELRRFDMTGAQICSTTDGGYYLAADLDELKAYLGQEERRLITIARKVNRQRRVAGLALSGQLALLGE